jgi:phosphate acyltransferase
MSQKFTIALDAMGGDHGPSTVVPGAALAVTRHPDVGFLLFGDEALITPLLNDHPKLKAVSKVHHTEVAVAMDIAPRPR